MAMFEAVDDLRHNTMQAAATRGEDGEAVLQAEAKRQGMTQRAIPRWDKRGAVSSCSRRRRTGWYVAVRIGGRDEAIRGRLSGRGAQDKVSREGRNGAGTREECFGRNRRRGHSDALPSWFRGCRGGRTGMRGTASSNAAQHSKRAGNPGAAAPKMGGLKKTSQKPAG